MGAAVATKRPPKTAGSDRRTELRRQILEARAELDADLEALGYRVAPAHLAAQAKEELHAKIDTVKAEVKQKARSKLLPAKLLPAKLPPVGLSRLEGRRSSGGVSRPAVLGTAAFGVAFVLGTLALGRNRKEPAEATGTKELGPAQ
ncbi:MAG: DUF3618 domain-containing protein [Acidimicrobiales bacterium]